MNNNDFEKHGEDVDLRHGFSWKEGGPEKELTPEAFRRFAIKNGMDNEEDIGFLWKARPESLKDLIKESNNYDKAEIDLVIKDMVAEFKQFDEILTVKGLERRDVESLWVTKPEHRLTDAEITILADDYMNILKGHRQAGEVEEEEEEKKAA